MTEPDQTTTDEATAADDVTVAVPDHTGSDEATAADEGGDSADETAEQDGDGTEPEPEPEATDEATPADGPTVDPVDAARYEAIGYPAGTETTKD